MHMFMQLVKIILINNIWRKEHNMVMLTFTVDENNKLINVKKSKEKGLFESKKDQKYADKILKKINERKKNGK